MLLHNACLLIVFALVLYDNYVFFDFVFKIITLVNHKLVVSGLLGFSFNKPFIKKNVY